MNIINSLLKRFGSKNQKVSAIELDIKQLEYEKQFLIKRLEKSEDLTEVRYLRNSIVDFESRLDGLRLDLLELQNG